MNIKLKKDVKEFMCKLKNGDYFNGIIHEKTFHFRDPDTEITYHPKDGWSVMMIGTDRWYMKEKEMKDYIFKNKEKINKRME